jgi:hypothetical protein
MGERYRGDSGQIKLFGESDFCVETPKMSRIMSELISKEKEYHGKPHGVGGGGEEIDLEKNLICRSGNSCSSLIPSLNFYPYSLSSLVSNIRGIAKQLPSMLKIGTLVLAFHKTTAVFPGSLC